MQPFHIMFFNCSIDILDMIRKGGNFLKWRYVRLKKYFGRFSNTNLVIRKHDVLVDSNGQQIFTFLVLNKFKLDESVLQKVREL